MNRPKLTSIHRNGFWRYLAVVSILAVAYFGAAKIAFSILDLDIDPSPFWPPAGLALAILLVEGRLVWPGVALGSFFFCRSLDIPELAAYGIAIGSTLQAIIGSELLHRMRFRPSLERLRDVLQLVVVGVWISPTINATISTIVAYLTHSLYPHSWQENWLILWLGDGMGILIVTPVLLVLSQAILELRSPSFNWAILRKSQIWSKLNPIPLIPKPASAHQEEKISQRVEALVCFSLLFAISWIVFSSKTTMGLAQYPLEYLPFPFVVWAALRLGQQGAVTATLIVCLGSIWGTAQGVGPFVAKADDIQQAILFLHGFMGVITVTALVLAAAETERASAVDLLKEREASLANAQRLAQLGNWDYYEMCHAKPIPQPHLRWSDELYRLFGFIPGDVEPSWEAFFEVVHPGDRERVGQAIRDALRDNQPYC
ncbi:MAG TPA: MASE1 domain-containing protein, partial [Cyanophyceae cyanobacterium]